MSCGSDPLGRPPQHGGGGHPHGGGHPARVRRGNRDFTTVPEFEVVQTTTCSAWGFPAPMNPDIDFIGKHLLSKNNGQPASAYYEGTLYLFSYQDGVIRAQPCTATVGALAAPPELLYYLYRSTAPLGGWAIVGGWFAMDQAQDEMAAVLKSAPTAELGAYVWDGATMIWRFF